jgi:hypothetical protein
MFGAFREALSNVKNRNLLKRLFTKDYYMVFGRDTDPKLARGEAIVADSDIFCHRE